MAPTNPISGKTGTATIKMVGQTETSKHGSNSAAKERGAETPRTLDIPSKG